MITCVCFFSAPICRRLFDDSRDGERNNGIINFSNKTGLDTGWYLKNVYLVGLIISLWVNELEMNPKKQTVHVPQLTPQQAKNIASNTVLQGSKLYHLPSHKEPPSHH